MTLGLDETNQGADRLTRVNRVAALGGVIAVVSGWPEVDDESFFREDLHLVTPYSLCFYYTPVHRFLHNSTKKYLKSLLDSEGAKPNLQRQPWFFSSFSFSLLRASFRSLQTFWSALMFLSRCTPSQKFSDQTSNDTNPMPVTINRNKSFPSQGSGNSLISVVASTSSVVVSFDVYKKKLIRGGAKWRLMIAER